MKVGLICIATGLIYQQYSRGLRQSASKYFPEADFILYSDMDRNPGVEHFFRIRCKGYPMETLMRYDTMLYGPQGAESQHVLRQYDQLFYCDADMEFVAPIEDIYSNGLTATLHPGFLGKKGSPETRKESNAYCAINKAYYCGGFQGGQATAYLTAADEMVDAINDDYRRGLTAVWHDESHWNKLLAYQPPSRILSPSYCFPEGYDGGYGWTKEQYPPILVALDKRKRGNHPRFQ